ncbi:unnamed protein product [Vitrella brassicaformis CCMP3155]|uniref:Uncharacterized protein n=2 Tax=Vitrella brassicaformis TaxID=1169539 RepID=A0A0G4ED76_VITBC|nr:unnamed protein product [Vitrella brassicaformis CCMP3155]|eukprot:CEL93637.1 unnamed protein product [Vitrella brassicaformis CCMP3155]
MAASGDGCLRLEDIDIRHRDGTSNATRQLSEGIIRRTFTHQQQVTDLIHNGADPNHQVRLRMLGPGEACDCGSRHPVRTGRYLLFSLAIDNWNGSAMPTVDFGIIHGRRTCRRCVLTLPHWSSPEAEAAILNVLIDGGARINEPTWGDSEPIRIAIRGGNESAMRVLFARGAAVRRPFPAFPSSWICPGPSLTESSPQGGRDALDLLVDNGASLTAVSGSESTPLYLAAGAGSPCVTDYLCRHVAAADIDRGKTTGDPNRTPLHLAACNLYASIEFSQDVNNQQDVRDHATSEIPIREAIIRTLLRSGADVGQMPTDTAWHRRWRELVLPRCMRVLNDIRTEAMAAVNAALAPQRSLAAFLMKSLPTLLPHLLEPPHAPAANLSPAPAGYGPHESEAIGWKIAAMCFDQDAANEAISAHIGIRDSDMARRVCGYRALRQVGVVCQQQQGGGGRDGQCGRRDGAGAAAMLRHQSRQPPTQVLHTRGRVGVREVVHRARLDEAARHGIGEGAIDKGFSEPLGNADCQFCGWQQLGGIDERGKWVTLGIN